MSTVRKDFKRRLARAEIMASAIHPADLEAAGHRQSLRMLTKVCLLIRHRFLLMGLDPALAASLQSGEKAAAELVAIPDTEGCPETLDAPGLAGMLSVSLFSLAARQRPASDAECTLPAL